MNATQVAVERIDQNRTLAPSKQQHATQIWIVGQVSSTYPSIAARICEEPFKTERRKS